MKKISKKLLVISLIIISTLIALLVVKEIIEPPKVSLVKDRNRIEKIINKKYDSYTIVDLELNYVDLFSSVREANNYNRATEATVIIANDNEQRTLHLDKNFFMWIIDSDQPDYGSNLPNDVYFVEMMYQSIGKAVNIEEHIKDMKYWVIPDEEGNYYKKSGNDENWYYSIKHCSNIYKTQNGVVYSFNKEISEWEISTVTYSELCYYSNYDKVDKKYAMNIIQTYSSYKDF